MSNRAPRPASKPAATRPRRAAGKELGLPGVVVPAPAPTGAAVGDAELVAVAVAVVVERDPPA